MGPRKSDSFASFQEFRAKEYFTGHHTTKIQYTVLEIQSWPIKCGTAVTVGYTKFSSNIPFFPIQVTQAKRYNGYTR